MAPGQKEIRLLRFVSLSRRNNRNRSQDDRLVLLYMTSPPGITKKRNDMQYSNKDYNPEKHDRWRALTVKQPYANDLVTAAYKDENGVVYGRKSIEVRSKKRHTVATFLFVRRQNRFIPEWKAALLWDWLSCTT